MQPYSVTCETCHARLKVLSESAIGQIVSCPKCGSMVQIAPPADWSVNSAEPTADAGEPLPQQPTTLAQRLSQPMALLAGASCALVATTLAAVLWSRGPAEAEGGVEPPPAMAATVEDKPTSAVAEVRAEPARTDIAAAPQTAADEPAASPLPPQSSPQSPQPVPTAIASETNDKAPAEPDPLGFNADAFDVDIPAEDETAASPVKILPAKTEPVKTQAADLAAHSSLLDPQSVVRLGPISSGAVRARDVKAQLSLPIESFEVSQVPLGELIETLSGMAAVPITLDPAALAMAGIAANQEVTLRAQKTTLALLLVDALAKHGLAYKIEDGQLIVVKQGAERRRSVDYELKDLVGQGGADATQLAELIQHVVVPDSWQSAGGSGTIAVEGTSLRVEQDGNIHSQVLTFCERLRLARELPTRSRYPVERLPSAPVYPQLDQRLEQPATFTFLPWTQLADVFRHWQEAADVTVLVDWSALAAQELGPTSPVACSVVDQPWQAAIDAILAPLGLTWWAVDGQTIQITSRDAAAQLRQVEFYPVDKQALAQYPTTAAYIAELQRGLAAQLAATKDNSQQCFLSFDEPSGRLIVLASPAVQRHLVAKLIALEPQALKAPAKRKPIFVDEGP